MLDDAIIVATDSFDWDSLLVAARNGQSDAKGALLENYRNYLHLLARIQIGQRLQGKADENDLVQETFMRACEAFANFRGTSEPQLVAWLRTILANQVANLVRHFLGTECRDLSLEVSVARELDRSSAIIDQGLLGKGSSPSQAAMRRELTVLVANALALLADSYREVLYLRHIEGLQFPEIAKRLGKSIDSVQKLWTRALPKFREAIGECP